LNSFNINPIKAQIMAAAKKTTATQTPFEKILTQSNSSIKAQRAKIASEFEHA
jgi:hypothetical protein